jgi:hypothetical protein
VRRKHETLAPGEAKRTVSLAAARELVRNLARQVAHVLLGAKRGRGGRQAGRKGDAKARRA